MNNNDPLKNRIYYSQNREDLILLAFFPDVENGFYVDVGASDPSKYSVTKLFYERGWSGVNVEPIKHHFESLQKQRPRDVNLNIGVGRTKALLTFHEYTGGDGLSTFSQDMATEYASQKDFPFKDGKEYKVGVQTLASVFAEQNIQHIHFLKVDVEGFEHDVLAGNDWAKYRPEVICIEANHITDDWRPLLKQSSYQLAFFDGLNEYYVDGLTQRLSKFNFVDTVVIERDGGISAGDYATVIKLRSEIEETHLRLQGALANAAEKDLQYNKAAQDNHINYKRAITAEHALRSPRALARHQARRLHGRILRKLTPTPQGMPYSPSEQTTRTNDLSQLAKATDNKQRLEAAQRIAESEINHLKKLHRANSKQPFNLRAYRRSVNTVKRLRIKRGGR